MKKVAVYYISSIVSAVSFLLMFLSFRNSGPNESFAPLLVVFLISAVISNLTKHSVHQVKEEMYRDMRQTYEAVHMQQAQENIQRILEITQDMQDEAARQAADDAMRAAETARLQNTGIEFGGYNPDPNLNPGMHFQQDSMMNMNSFNNGSGMF